VAKKKEDKKAKHTGSGTRYADENAKGGAKNINPSGGKSKKGPVGR
jgi:hypothetical protein